MSTTFYNFNGKHDVPAETAIGTITLETHHSTGGWYGSSYRDTTYALLGSMNGVPLPGVIKLVERSSGGDYTTYDIVTSIRIGPGTATITLDFFGHWHHA